MPGSDSELDLQDQNQNDETDPQQISTDNTTTPESQSTEAQTQTPQEPVQDSKQIMNLYDQVIREKDAQIRRLLEEQQQQAQPQTPPLSADEQKNRFFNEPMNVIREEINRSVAPLLEFTKKFNQQNVYTELKGRYKNDPRFAQIFPQIEATVDSIMANSEVNEQNMYAAILSAIGMLTTGLIPGGAPNTTSTPTAPTTSQTPKPPVTTPAHLRPTAPAAPQKQKAPVRQLTENERRLARMHGMTPEQYIAYMELDSTQVATYKEPTNG